MRIRAEGAPGAVFDGEAITAFLESMTGTMPEVVYPVLPPETADTPRQTDEVK